MSQDCITVLFQPSLRPAALFHYLQWLSKETHPSEISTIQPCCLLHFQVSLFSLLNNWAVMVSEEHGSRARHPRESTGVELGSPRAGRAPAR